jgi:transcriptional regulator GlxA family with amidase domain
MRQRTCTEIGIVIYPQAQMAAVHGLTDLFRVANRFASERVGIGAPELRISHWQLRSNDQQLWRVFDTHQNPPEPLDALVLPPSVDTVPKGPAITPYAQWVKGQHAAGTIICSVCAGAFVLGDAGLLDGRPATTHWTHSEVFARRFEKVQIDVDKLIIDDGDIVTAGGLMAWVDLGLNLIERFVSPAIMVATARYFLVDAVGREQRFYSSFSPRMNHGDAAIVKVQRWLQTHQVENLTVAAMSSHANLSERTFLRRFESATGMPPTEYLQHLRVDKARAELEFSRLAIQEIAWKVGYKDPSSFRKVFQKVVGLTPGDYRRRFNVAGSK